MTDGNDEIIGRLVEFAEPHFAVLARAVSKHCGEGTPIERLFMMGLLVRCHWDWFPYAVYQSSGLADLQSLKGITCLHPRRPLCIFPQHPLRQYRADFMLAWATRVDDPESVRVLCVECDGHDFHERTKAQAQHDKSRDRKFMADGVPVMRFTGSELTSRPGWCGHEALQLFIDWREADELSAMRAAAAKFSH